MLKPEPPKTAWGAAKLSPDADNGVAECTVGAEGAGRGKGPLADPAGSQLPKPSDE